MSFTSLESLTLSGLAMPWKPVERTQEMRKLVVQTFMTLDGVMQAPADRRG